jgi:hypothetical protein
MFAIVQPENWICDDCSLSSRTKPTYLEFRCVSTCVSCRILGRLMGFPCIHSPVPFCCPLCKDSCEKWTWALFICEYDWQTKCKVNTELTLLCSVYHRVTWSSVALGRSADRTLHYDESSALDPLTVSKSLWTVSFWLHHDDIMQSSTSEDNLLSQEEEGGLGIQVLSQFITNRPPTSPT